MPPRIQCTQKATLQAAISRTCSQMNTTRLADISRMVGAAPGAWPRRADPRSGLITTIARLSRSLADRPTSLPTWIAARSGHGRALIRKRSGRVWFFMSSSPVLHRSSTPGRSTASAARGPAAGGPRRDGVPSADGGGDGHAAVPARAGHGPADPG